MQRRPESDAEKEKLRMEEAIEGRKTDGRRDYSTQRRRRLEKKITRSCLAIPDGRTNGRRTRWHLLLLNGVTAAVAADTPEKGRTEMSNGGGVKTTAKTGMAVTTAKPPPSWERFRAELSENKLRTKHKIFRIRRDNLQHCVTLQLAFQQQFGGTIQTATQIARLSLRLLGRRSPSSRSASLPFPSHV